MLFFPHPAIAVNLYQMIFILANRRIPPPIPLATFCISGSFEYNAAVTWMPDANNPAAGRLVKGEGQAAIAELFHMNAHGDLRLSAAGLFASGINVPAALYSKEPEIQNVARGMGGANPPVCQDEDHLV
jgi:hypothetical protein